MALGSRQAGHTPRKLLVDCGQSPPSSLAVAFLWAGQCTQASPNGPGHPASEVKLRQPEARVKGQGPSWAGSLCHLPSANTGGLADWISSTPHQYEHLVIHIIISGYSHINIRLFTSGYESLYIHIIPSGYPHHNIKISYIRLEHICMFVHPLFVRQGWTIPSGL